MRTSARRSRTALAALFLMLVASVVPPGAAAAASYGGQRGSGYSVVNSLDLVEATVFLTYNAGNGNNRVAFGNTPGDRLLMNVWLKRSPETPADWRHDRGFLTTYAGPVHRAAAGTRVDWGGYRNGSEDTRYGTNRG
ncbi:spore-associated protein A [Actinoalloteichus sp. AHMU CJ021]|uniref:spore-associated protein A n=1 Tax=Actinoalloteichus sp. AHMU CJ021 TaxID=2072503 RepID=UPI000CA014C4|nr:spore-associated protein A [Actinoalloteichus sp. AHMU CJ021]